MANTPKAMRKAQKVGAQIARKGLPINVPTTKGIKGAAAVKATIKNSTPQKSMDTSAAVSKGFYGDDGSRVSKKATQNAKPTAVGAKRIASGQPAVKSPIKAAKTYTKPFNAKTQK
jgi:hypothetical protein